MNDSSSSIVKIGIFAAAGYLLYQYLQNSGLWAQYFGGALPAGPAAPAAGTSTTPATATTTTTPAATTPAGPTIDTGLAARMTTMLQEGQGRSTANQSEWNWIYRHQVSNPDAPIIEFETSYGATGPMTATQYLQERSKAGLSGIAWYRGSFVQRPLSRFLQ